MNPLFSSKVFVTNCFTPSQVRYEPILIRAKGPGAENCTPIEYRSSTRSCNAIRQDCGTCENLRLNSGESDIDCGGGLTDDAVNSNFRRTPNVFQVIDYISQQSVGTGLIDRQSGPQGGNICPRCGMGQKCR